MQTQALGSEHLHFPTQSPIFSSCGDLTLPAPPVSVKAGLDRWGRARTRSLGPEPQRQSSGSTDPGRRWGSQLEAPVPVTAHFLPTAPPTPVTDSPGAGPEPLTQGTGPTAFHLPDKTRGGCSRRAHSRRQPRASVASRMPPALGGSGFRILTSLLLLAAPGESGDLLPSLLCPSRVPLLLHLSLSAPFPWCPPHTACSLHCLSSPQL